MVYVVPFPLRVEATATSCFLKVGQTRMTRKSWSSTMATNFWIAMFPFWRRTVPWRDHHSDFFLRHLKLKCVRSVRSSGHLAKPDFVNNCDTATRCNICCFHSATARTLQCFLTLRHVMFTLPTWTTKSAWIPGLGPRPKAKPPARWLMSRRTV